MVIIGLIVLVILNVAALGWAFQRGSQDGVRGFLTGSQVYGKGYRQSNSDIDLVLLVDSFAFEKLKPFTKIVKPVLLDSYHATLGRRCLRIKQQDLDLIITDDYEEFMHWKRWTKALSKEEGLTRADAVANLKRRSACRGKLQMLLDKTRLSWLVKPACKDTNCWYCRPKPMRVNLLEKVNTSQIDYQDYAHSLERDVSVEYGGGERFIG